MSADITYRTTDKSDGNLRRLTFQQFNTSCSWTRQGVKGHVEIDVQGHAVAGWLSIWTLEHAETGGSKRTGVTLRREDVAALRDLCNEVLAATEGRDQADTGPMKPEWVEQKARDLWATDEIEIDDTLTSRDFARAGDDATWVRAWVYVPDESEGEG